MKNLIRKLTRCALFSAFLSMPVVQAATVDWLVLYDDYSNTYFNGDPQTAMNGWVAQMNNAYSSSGVDIQLRLVGVRRVAPSGSTMSEVLSNVRTNSTANSLRDELGADFVSQLHRTGSCGVGYVSVDERFAWNVTGPQCGFLTAIHELGHNMGLNHSRRQGNTSGRRYAYGLGYGVDNTFASIMAYASAFSAPRVSRFSSPDYNCNGARCGVPIGDSQQAFAARAIHNVRDEIAGFRSTQVNTNTFRLEKRNAGSFSIDGGNGGGNAQNVYLWGSNSSNVNQQWVEVNRGGGYYSYQKNNTSYCLDGGRGGANGQNLYLWTCGSGNQNQHWRKVDVGSGSYRLEKRNAPGFSIDGNRGGGNRQNVYLWQSNNANQNQHWVFK